MKVTCTYRNLLSFRYQTVSCSLFNQSINEFIKRIYPLWADLFCCNLYPSTELFGENTNIQYHVWKSIMQIDFLENSDTHSICKFTLIKLKSIFFHISVLIFCCHGNRNFQKSIFQKFWCLEVFYVENYIYILYIYIYFNKQYGQFFK